MPVVACILLACSLLPGAWSRNRLGLRVIHRESLDNAVIGSCIESSQQELWAHATLERLLGKHDLAVDLYRCLVERFPNDYLARFWLGELLLSEGANEDQVVALWRNSPVVAVIAANCEQAWRVAWDTQADQKWDIAWQKCRWASEITPENQRVWYLYGRTAAKLWKLAEAQAALEHAIALSDSPSSELRYLLASVYRVQKEPRRALSLLRPLILEFPDYADARFELGVTLLDLNECDEAVRHLSVAIPKFEANKTITGRMYLSYALALQCVGQEVEARRTFMLALATSPQDDYVRKRVDEYFLNR